MTLDCILSPCPYDLSLILHLPTSMICVGVKETTLSGIVLMTLYMSMDSFTSNWQSKLFSTYNMTSVQMMCGVNFFSCLFTAVSLLSQGILLRSFVFMAQVYFQQFSMQALYL